MPQRTVLSHRDNDVSEVARRIWIRQSRFFTTPRIMESVNFDILAAERAVVQIGLRLSAGRSRGTQEDRDV